MLTQPNKADIPPDALHLYDLGTGRKIINHIFYSKFDKEQRFLNHFDERFVKLKTPSEFSRGCQTMTNKRTLKAKEIQGIYMIAGESIGNVCVLFTLYCFNCNF